MTNPFRKSSSAPAYNDPNTSPFSQDAAHAAPSRYELASFPDPNANTTDLTNSTPPSRGLIDSSLPSAQVNSQPLVDASSDTYNLDLEGGRQPPVIQVTEELERYRAAGGDLSKSTTHNSATKKIPKSQVKAVPSSDSVWPTQQELKDKFKLTERARLRKNWNPCSNLSRKQRVLVGFLLALVVIAGGVGIGVGVSQAVGGTTYDTPGQTKPIPDPESPSQS